MSEGAPMPHCSALEDDLLLGPATSPASCSFGRFMILMSEPPSKDVSTALPLVY